MTTSASAAPESLVDVPDASPRGWAAGVSARPREAPADRLRAWLALNLLSPVQGMTLSRAAAVVGRSAGWGPVYWPRAALLLASGAVNSAFAAAERAAYRRAWEKVEPPPPLFILGHYRGGTTHLQNLLALDPRFAFPNLYQAFFPETFLLTERFLAPVVAAGLVRQRFQDSVMLGVGVPMEDEIAVGVSTGVTPHLAWALPRREAEYDAYLTLRDVPPGAAERWREGLLRFVRKLTLAHGKPLVLKSPTHTARVRLLLELFPDARFVHIHRDPYAVYGSTLHMLNRVTPYWRLQPPGPGTRGAQERVLSTYTAMYDAYFEDRGAIPPGRLYELGYAELDQDPEGALRRLYAGLGLGDAGPVAAAARDYLAQLSGYRKNSRPDLDPETRRRVADAWRRSFREWGYPT